ncbi:MAG: hypothetical protein WCP82_06885 [Alphaproteobacteria bacterium]
MAQVQTREGVPSVAPDAIPGNNYQTMRASAEAFGSDIGTGMKGKANGMTALAGGLADVGQAAFKEHDFFSQVQVEDSLNKAMTDVNKHLDGYRALEGQDALRARADVEKNIAATFKSVRDGLKDPKQAFEFDRTARGYQQGFINSQINAHAVQQGKVYSQNTIKAGLELTQTNVATAAMDPEQVEHFREDMRALMVRKAQLEGSGDDPKILQAAIEQADRATYKTQIQVIGANNPALAMSVADKHKDVLGPEYDNIVNPLRARYHEQQGEDIGNNAITATGAEIQAAPDVAQKYSIRQALADQESGNKGPNPFQIQQTTWDRWVKEGLVHAGETFGEETAMRAVGNRAIDKYADQYRDPKTGQPDPSRIAVAWFSGPGNVAPEGSPQPFRQDLGDGNKTVSGYVADIARRLGTTEKGQHMAVRAGVYDKVLSETEGQPYAVRAAAFKTVAQRLQASEIATASNTAALTQQREVKLREYGDQIRQGSIAQPWHQDPAMTEQQVRDLDDYQEKKFKPELQGSASNPGEGFAGAYQGVLTGEVKNLEQLLPQLRAGKLTPWGYDFLEAKIKKYKEPGQDIARRQEADGFASAKRQITMDTMGGPVNAEKLKEWDKAIIIGSRAVEQGREKGKTDAEIFDPDKGDFWRSMKPFLPNPNELMEATINGDLDAAKKAAEAKRPAFDASKLKSYDELREAYAAGTPGLTKELAGQIALQRGWRKSVTPDGKPAVPVSQPLAKGQKEPGNLDPFNRPTLKNADGTTSTTSSISVGTDRGEVLIPTVVDGKRLTNEQAIEHFKKTGQHFGIFATPEDADAFAVDLHNRQADSLGLTR